MTLKLYNTLTKKKQEFKTVFPSIVRMYNCGPTVYMDPHIGNYRSFLFADLLKRYLQYKGYTVQQVMNITDVGHMTVDDQLGQDSGEDKLVKAAKKEGKTPLEIAAYYTKRFFADMDKLNIDKAMVYPKATEHIQEMIMMTEALLKNGYAYESNGSVYFDVTTFEGYGQLSGNTLDTLKEGKGGRVTHNPDKKHHYDFALWVNDEKHVMQWKSPWCEKGYPGWHIECSAMAAKHLTHAFDKGNFNPSLFEPIDIHTGGEDNIFPHHECEIAQTTGSSGKPFAHFWLHARFLQVYGEKMSKSKGNLYTLSQIEEKGYSARVLRYLLLSAHYRSSLNFTFEGLDAAASSVQRIDDFMRLLKQLVKKGEQRSHKEIVGLLKQTKESFEAGLDDDLNISVALAAVFEMIGTINKLVVAGEVGSKDAVAVLALMEKFDLVLGVLEEEENIPAIVKQLAEERLQARNEKNWEKADLLRKKIHEHGYEVDDVKDGFMLKRR